MNMQKRFINKMRGITLRWEDITPTASTERTTTLAKVGHRNPVHRVRAHRIWLEGKDKAHKQQRLLWVFKIGLVFRFPDGREEIENIDLRGMATIDELNDLVLELLEEALEENKKDMQHYVTTKFDIECLGQ